MIIHAYALVDANGHILTEILKNDYPGYSIFKNERGARAATQALGNCFYREVMITIIEEPE